jgi:glutathione S-transferase
MIQLFQAEWCPYSSIVRQRLTELGVDYVIRQVAPDPPDRDALLDATGGDSIPALVLEDGTVLTGDTGEILEALDQHFPAHEWEAGHKRQDELHSG